jgi:hypothetical protein
VAQIVSLYDSNPKEISTRNDKIKNGKVAITCGKEHDGKKRCLHSAGERFESG